MLPEKAFSMSQGSKSLGQGPGIWSLKFPQKLLVYPCRTGGQPLRVDGGSLDTPGQGRKCQRRLGKNLALRHRQDLKRALNVEQIQLRVPTGSSGGILPGW